LVPAADNGASLKLKNFATWPRYQARCSSALVRQTIAALDEMDIDYVIPLHCSGEMFYDLAKAEMPSKLLRSYTGTRCVFDGVGA
jgi:hypothetical protein